MEICEICTSNDARGPVFLGLAMWGLLCSRRLGLNAKCCLVSMGCWALGVYHPLSSSIYMLHYWPKFWTENLFLYNDFSFRCVSILFVLGPPVCSIMIKCFLNSLILCFFFNFFSLFSSMSSVSTSLNLWPGTTCCELRSDFILESQLSACRSANQCTNEWDFSPRKYVPAKFNRKLTWSYTSHACPLLHN